MSLITAEELVRGLLIGTLGGAAGLCTVLVPGSPLWIVPATLAAGGCALTVPEVRAEAVRGMAQLPAPLQPSALPATLRALPAQAAALAKGARAAQQARDAGRAGNAAPAPAQAAQAPARPQPAATPARPRWLEMVNDDPDRTPHALVLGGSGSGKTTMATAIMGDRGGRAVVLTPKLTPANWAGAEIVTLDDDGSYAPIGVALADLEEEKRRRIGVLRREGREALEPLTIVLDELVDLTSRVPAAGELMVNLSSVGRELNMRLVGVGTTDDALGVKGWKASRNNYVRVEMDEQRRATIAHGARRVTVSARDALGRAEAATLRPWRGEPAPVVAATAATATTTDLARHAPAAAPDDLLAALLAQMTPERAERLRNAIPPRQDAEGMGVTPVPGNGSNDGGESHSSLTVTRGNGDVIVNATLIAPEAPAPKDRVARTAYERALVELYRAAGAEGLTFANVYKLHKGTKEIVFPAWQEGRDGRNNP